MKKITLSAALLVLTLAVSAQGFKLGLHASPGLSWLSPQVKEWSNEGLKPSFSYGVIFDYNFTDNYALGSGINHVVLSGGNIKHVDSASTIDYSLQYLEVPLTLKLKTNEIGYMTYFGQFGITPGANIKARDKADNDVMGNVSLFNLGLTIGAGLEYSLGGETAFLANLGYNNGFTNVFEKDSGIGKTTLNKLFLRLDILF